MDNDYFGFKTIIRSWIFTRNNLLNILPHVYQKPMTIAAVARRINIE